eukprot:3873-Eustigmatos_ZCMA.PRE.1
MREVQCKAPVGRARGAGLTPMQLLDLHGYCEDRAGLLPAINVDSRRTVMSSPAADTHRPSGHR